MLQAQMSLPKFWQLAIDGGSRTCQFFGMSKEVRSGQTRRERLELTHLSRREQQIMDALYRLRTASAGEIRDALADPPTYTAVRTHLTLLEQKGQVTHKSDGTRYRYSPVVPPEEMKGRVMDRVLRTFFDNSVEQVVTALVKSDQSRLSDAQLARLEKLIHQARKEGR
jgi:predicted transcriptional regulator